VDSIRDFINIPVDKKAHRLSKYVGHDDTGIDKLSF